MAAKNKKKHEQEAGSWVRIAIFAITTLEPIINLLLARLRERVEAAEIAETLKQAKYRNVSETTHADTQERVQKDLSKRSHAAHQGLVTQERRRWIVFGFAIGLSCASIATFLLLRRRFRQQAEETLIYFASEEEARAQGFSAEAEIQ